MRGVRLAWHVLRHEGLRSLWVRCRRVAFKRVRFALYRLRRATGIGVVESPVYIVAADLHPTEVAVLEAVWQLGGSGPVRVLLPDFLHCPLASILRLSGKCSITAFSYSEFAVAPNLPFNAIVLQNGLMHRLPLELVEHVLADWAVDKATRAAALLTSALPARELDSEEDACLEDLRNMAHAMRKLVADELLYEAPFGATIRCHYSDMEVGMIHEVWSEYFGSGIDVLPGDVVVDIGANIGAFAVAYGMRNPNGTVLAFEPCPDNFRLLEENIARNCPGAVEARPMAVHRDGASRQLFLDPEHSGAHSLYERRWAEGAVPVKCISLPAILDEIGKVVDVLKIDAEGSEYEILFGCGDLLNKRVRTIVMEVHRCGQWNCADMEQFLRGLGWSVETKGGPNLMLLLARGPMASLNRDRAAVAA